MGDIRPIYVLVHSPLVGPLTWTLVANELRRRDRQVLVPALVDSPDSNEPFWKQHADSVARALENLSGVATLILVAHSGAGPLLPAIRQSLPNPVQAYVSVDAGIPGDGASRLDLMKAEDLQWGREFEQYLQTGGLFPTWSFDDLQQVIPDEGLRQRTLAEMRPRGEPFFTEPIPVFDGWPDAPGVYIQWSAVYEQPAAQARQLGWPTYELQAGHFHMLVEPETVAELIVNATNK